MSSTVTHPEVPEIRTVPQDRAILGLVVILGCVVWLFWEFFVQQGRFAINQQADWGHT